MEVGARAFIERVAGPGVHYIAWPGSFRVVGDTTRPVWYHRDFTDALTAVSFAQELTTRFDVYYTPAAFKVAKTVDQDGRQKSFRKQENVASLRSFFLDLDFKRYDTPAAAIAAFSAALDTTKLPRPNAIVATGGGLHCYWVLDDAVRLAEWQPVANGLAEALRNTGLIADYQCTIDSARILRVPGTSNRKYTHAPICKVVKWEPADIAFDVVASAVAGYSSVTSVAATLRAPAGVLAALQDAPNSDLTDGFVRGRTYAAERVASGCQIIAASLAKGGEGDDYPLWLQILHTLAYAEDGEDVARRASVSDPRFTESGFQAVWQERLRLAKDGNLGPTTCEKFNQLTGRCAGCPHAGKIKTPLVLGYSIPEHRAEDVATSATPAPTYTRHGATFMMRRTPEGDPEEVMVAACEIEGWELGHDKEAGRFIRFRVTAGPNKANMMLPMSNAADERELQKALLAAGLPVAKGGAKLFGSAMIGWMEHLQRKRRIDVLPPFGWDAEGGFSVAGARYLASGAVETSGSAEGVIGQAYSTSGTLEEWAQLSAAFTADPRPQAHTMIACAFAAPLLRFVEQPSFLLAVCGPLSGVGKTTLLRYVAAVWGDPGLGIMSLDDTANSVSQRMALTRYMPSLWDELRSEGDFDRFVTVAFRSLQGQSKQRLNSRSELRPVPPINTVMLTTSNASVMDAVALRTRGSPAGLYRLLETEMPPIPAGSDSGRVTAAAVGLKDTYGIAGRVYAAKLAAAGIPAVKQVVLACQAKLEKMLAPNPMERFWLQGSAVVLAGAVLAKRLGVAEVDAGAVLGCLRDAMLSARKRVATHNVDASNAAAEVLNRFSGNVAILSHVTLASKAEVIMEPQSRIARVFVGVQDRKVVIPHAIIEEYALSRGLSASQLRNTMVLELGGQDTQCNPGAGSPYALGKTRAVVLDVVRALGADYLRRYT